MQARWGSLLAVLAFSATCWAANGGWTRPEFDVDTFDYAQMSRQVARGEGFTMLQTFPYVQRYVMGRGFSSAPPWPNTTRFPLIAVFEAATFRAIGATDTAILVTGGMLFVATAGLVFLLASRLFGAWAGVIAALAVSTDAAQLRFSRSGLLETGAGLLLVAAAYALSRAMEDTASSRRWSLALGVACGLAFLQRYDLLVLAPVALAVAWAGSDGKTRAGRLAAVSGGFVVVTAPWILRNLAAFGTVLGSTSIDRNLLGGVLQGDVYMATTPLSAWQVAMENWPALLGKFEIAAKWFAAHAGSLLGGALPTACAAAVLPLPFATRDRAVRSVWGLLVGVFVTRALLLSLMHNEPRFYYSYTPLVLALAAGLLTEAKRRWWPSLWYPEAAVCAALMVAAVAAIPQERAPGVTGAPSPVFAMISSQLPPRALVASDHSWYVAWYSDRPSIRYSGSWKELASIEAAGTRVEAVMMRGPSGLAFDREHLLAGGNVFQRIPDFPSGYRLWLRRAGSPSITAPAEGTAGPGGNVRQPLQAPAEAAPARP